MKTKQAVIIICVALVSFLAGYFMRSHNGPSFEKGTTDIIKTTQSVTQNTPHTTGSVIGRWYFMCDGDKTITVTGYTPVNTHSSIRLEERGAEIDVWATKGSNFYRSADNIYEFYDVPLNAYVMENNNPIRTGCWEDESKSENLYGI